MSLRVKFAVSMAVLAAFASITVGAISYASTVRELRGQVDQSLRAAGARYVRDAPIPVRPGLDDPGVPRSFTQILVQVIDRGGNVLASPRTGALPVRDVDREIAAGRGQGTALGPVSVDGEEYRMLTVSTPSGAVQLARSLEETERIARRIRNRAVLIVIGMSAVGLALGLVIAQQVTRRLVRLTDAATGVAASGDVEVQVPVEGDDETGRLGAAFNGMLASLARSRRAQAQLVQDAGHELRTPLTSLRTNIAVMHRFGELSPASQQRLLDDLDSETKELTALVDELVELATERRDEEQPERVAMGELARHVVDRAVRRSGRRITLTADDSVVIARPGGLERAMSNVVGNALKFSDGDVEVNAVGGRFEVLDRGPGIEAHDLDRVFDRFYRSAQARALPGSGLGLSIVREVAESHGGSVFATNRSGGGSSVGFVLPAAPAAPASAATGTPLPPPSVSPLT